MQMTAHVATIFQSPHLPLTSPYTIRFHMLFNFVKCFKSQAYSPFAKIETTLNLMKSVSKTSSGIRTSNRKLIHISYRLDLLFPIVGWSSHPKPFSKSFRKAGPHTWKCDGELVPLLHTFSSPLLRRSYYLQEYWQSSEPLSSSFKICSDELTLLLFPMQIPTRRTKILAHSHSFVVHLEKPRDIQFFQTFIPTALSTSSVLYIQVSA